MVRPFAIISLRLDVSCFVKGDTRTLFYFSQRPNDSLKKMVLLITEEQEGLSNN